MNMLKKSFLNILSWNIQGLNTRLKPTLLSNSSSKLEITSIRNYLNNYDIVFLQETWLKEKKLNFKDYVTFSSIEKVTSKRGHGGISVLIKQNLENKINFIKSQSQNIIWCKLNKNKFGLNSDIFIGNIYLPPLRSQKKTAEDVISTLESEIQKYSKEGQIILLGDFNARTGLLNDFIEHDFIDSTNTNDVLDIYTTDNHFPKRNNSDIKINELGEKLLKMCISNRLRILNGRKTGDLDGKMTSYQSSGTSTIDYGIVNEAYWDQIISFQVENLTYYSDHCPISLKLKTPSFIENKNTRIKVNSKTKCITRFIWKQTSAEDFQTALNTEHLTSMMKRFSENGNTESSCNQVHEFNEIIKEAAKLSLKRKSFKTVKQTKTKKWFDSDCSNIKKQLKKITKQLNNSTNNTDHNLRNTFFRIKKQYKKIVRKKHREYKNKLFQEMQSLDPKCKGAFWTLINELKKTNRNNKPSIPSEEWITHFKSLLHDPNKPLMDFEIETNEVDYKNDNILQNTISEKEINEHINKIKMKKAPGLDGITNEMLKHGRFYFVPLLYKMFNNIFNN